MGWVSERETHEIDCPVRVFSSKADDLLDAGHIVVDPDGLAGSSGRIGEEVIVGTVRWREGGRMKSQRLERA